MKVQYLQDKREELLKKSHAADTAIQGITVFIWLYLPLFVIFIPVLLAPDESRNFDAVVVSVTWFCFAAGIVSVAVFAGWGPVQAVLIDNYNKYVTEELVTDYADRVLSIIVDGDTPADLRRERLGRLQELRGSKIRDTLRRYLNVQVLLQFPVCVVWGAFYVLWLFPDLAGGLPEAEKAIIRGPWLRVALAVLGTLFTMYNMGYGLARAMARPHVLFEERIRREVLPHARKLHSAIQLFPDAGTHETLLAWVRGQEICMRILGVQVDSSLPGKTGSMLLSLVGVVAYFLARENMLGR